METNLTPEFMDKVLKHLFSHSENGHFSLSYVHSGEALDADASLLKNAVIELSEMDFIRNFRPLKHDLFFGDITSKAIKHLGLGGFVEQMNRLEKEIDKLQSEVNTLRRGNKKVDLEQLSNLSEITLALTSIIAEFRK